MGMSETSFGTADGERTRIGWPAEQPSPCQTSLVAALPRA